MPLNYFFYIGIISFSFLITYFIRKIAISKSILDIPNDRSSHTIPTPRGGGLAVAIVWFSGLIWLFFQGQIERSIFLALLCGFPLTLIGFADDIFNLKPGIRFFVQFICTAAALFILDGLNSVQFGTLYLLWKPLLTLFAFLGIVWSINLFNFLDGIDGYIGTEVLFIGIAAYLLLGFSLGLLLGCSVLGFLIWNWPKAKIFMGDVGSTLLGFTIAVIAIYHQNTHLSNIPVWLILTSVFWFDATLTLWRRFRNKEKLSVAHRKHAYQRIVQSGWSHQKTTLGAMVLNFIGYCLAFLAFHYPHYDWFFLASDILFLYIINAQIDQQKAFEKL